MSTILVSGDSWTSCWPLEARLGHRDNGWPNLVALKLNYRLIDKSRAGSSNYRIYRKAFDGLLDSSNNLVLVFLTSWTRMETGSGYGEKPGRIYQHISGQKTKETEYVFKQFFNGYKNYTDMLRMIISLQTIAKSQDTNCYFLDTFENNLLFDITLDKFRQILKFNMVLYDNMDDCRVENKFNTVKLLTAAIDRSMFISKSTYQALIKDCNLVEGHPVEDGHYKIANVVLEFLKEKYNGKTI
tara:strand:+ start:29 stop:754 length:726 start_codon:yes stop_codon:yes gene_type:complete